MTDAERLFTLHQAAAVRRRTDFDLAARRQALKRLQQGLDRHRQSFLDAMASDFGKNPTESLLWEVLPVQIEIAHARRHLRRWMRPRRVMPALTMIGTSARVRAEPKGVTLVIAPWNFPMMLALGPMVSALAAGNSVILKPSELTPATSAALAAMIRDIFPEDLVAVVEGGPEVAGALLDLPFDHIFFTGSTAVGRIVMEKAARHLTPVTLELGGRSPVIVGPDADIAKAARWIVWGRFANAGQTCVAPDHVYVHRSVEGALTEALVAEIARRFGPTEEARHASPDLARVVNGRNFDRLGALLAEAVGAGATLVTGGSSDAGARYVAPTILTGTTPDMRIRQEEIFGPLLPLVAYDDLAAPLAEINAGAKPLALYVFARDAALIDRIRRETSSGGMGINLSVVQFVHPNLPFGGIGPSGMGAAHGRAGFETFSHLKPVLRNRFSLMPLIFPPYGLFVRRLAGALVRFLR